MRIERLAVPPAPVPAVQQQLEVEMRRVGGGIARGTNVADDIAGLQRLPLGEPGRIALQVGVVVDEALVGVDGVDREPAEVVGAHLEDAPRIGAQDGRPARGHDVERRVDPGTATRREGVGDPLRPHAGHRDHEALGAKDGRELAPWHAGSRRVDRDRELHRVGGGIGRSREAA